MKRVDEWYDKVIDASGLERDPRFRTWVKIVVSVDADDPTGYAFKGKFLREGTSELEIRPRLLLVRTGTGSRKYPTAHYGIVRMRADGTLEATDIRTNDKKPGWALRIRDATAALLKEVRAEAAGEAAKTASESNPALAGISDEELLTEVRRRGLLQ